jgi:hypothetical protein
MLADDDILNSVGVSDASEWQRLVTPLTTTIDGMSYGRYVTKALFGPLVHKATTYLTGNGAALFREQLISLHKECIPGSATLTVNPQVVAVGSTVRSTVIVTNENGRLLLGRKTTPGAFEDVLKPIDSVTFLAYAPRDTAPYLGLSISPNLWLATPVEIPLVSVPVTITERDTSEWVPIEASNGGLGSPAPGVVPSDPWDGSEGSCYQVRHVTGEGASYVDYELHCGRRYTIDYIQPATLVTGLPVVSSRVKWKGADGTTNAGGNTAGCGPEHCLSSVTVELLEGGGHAVGRGTVAVP